MAKAKEKEKPSIITEKDVKDKLEEIKIPKKVVAFISTTVKPDPEPENPGRKLGFKSENIPSTDRVKMIDDEFTDVTYVEREDRELSLEKGYISFYAPNNPEKYRFLMRHSRNASNPNRVSKYPPIFKIFDPEKDKEEVFETMKKEFDIQARIYGEKDFNKIMAFAKAIGVSTDQSSGAIVHDVAIKVKANPKMIELLDTKETQIKAYIYDAIQKGILRYESNRFGWVNGAEFKPIVTVPLGTEANTYFAKWLETDDTGVLELMLEQLKASA